MARIAYNRIDQFTQSVEKYYQDCLVSKTAQVKMKGFPLMVVDSFFRTLVERLSEQYPKCSFWFAPHPLTNMSGGDKEPFEIIEVTVVMMYPINEPLLLTLPSLIDLDTYSYDM